MIIRNRFLQTPLFTLFTGVLAVVLGAAVSFGTLWLDSPGIVIAGIIGLIAMSVITLRPHIGLGLLAFITYTRFSDVLVQFHGVPSIAKAFVLLLFGVVLFRWVMRYETPSGWQRSTLFISLYTFVAMLSILYAADLSRTMDSLSDLVKDALIAIIVVLLLTNGADFKRIVWILLFAGLFMASISAYQYLTATYTNNYFGFGQAQIQTIIGETNDYRVSGPIGDANFYAQIIVSLVPLALERVWHERNALLRLIAGFTLIVCLITVIATFSRGGFLALLVMMIALLLLFRARPTQLFVAAVLATVFIQFAPQEYLARLGTLLDFLPGNGNALAEVSLRGRTSENTVGWMMFNDHPILGVGLNNYTFYYLSYARNLGLESRLEERAAHSLYLQIAAEQGMMGLLVFGLLVAGAFYSLYYAHHRLQKAGKTDLSAMTISFAVALMGYLTAAIFLHNAYPRFFWLLIGIAFAAHKMAEAETTPQLVESPSVHG